MLSKCYQTLNPILQFSRCGYLESSSSLCVLGDQRLAVAAPGSEKLNDPNFIAVHHQLVEVCSCQLDNIRATGIQSQRRTPKSCQKQPRYWKWKQIPTKSQSPNKKNKSAKKPFKLPEWNIMQNRLPKDLMQSEPRQQLESELNTTGSVSTNAAGPSTIDKWLPTIV